MEKEIKTTPFYAKLAYILISLLALGYMAILGKTILAPLIFSFLFAILLLPFANLLEVKVKLPRSLSALISVISLLLGISLVIYLVGSQMTDLANDWPMFRDQLIASLHGLQDWIADRFNIDKTHQIDYVTEATSKMLSSGTAVLGATVLSLSGVMLFMIFSFIYTFFFLLYRSLIMRFLVSVFSERSTHIVHEIIEQTQYIIRKYLMGLLLQMAIIASIACLAFWILGLKYAVLLGLITGIFNVIPYLGIFTAMLISSLITFATVGVFSKVLIVIVTVLIIHAIDSNILLPVVVGSKVKINALVTVLGVVIGEMMWGIPGMFLSIPVIAVIKIIFDRVDGLKPWGMLLGDEEKKHKKKHINI